MGATQHVTGPRLTPPPPAFTGTFWDEEQWRTLFAFLDVIAPPIVTEQTVTDRHNQMVISQGRFDEAYRHIRATATQAPDLDQFKEFLRSRPSDSVRFVENVKRTVEYLPQVSKDQLGRALRLLDTRVGSKLMSGYCTPVSKLPLHLRHAVLQSWMRSWIGTFPLLAKAVTGLAAKAYGQVDPLLHQMIGYEDRPREYRPATGYDFRFLQFAAEEQEQKQEQEPVTIETDIVVVGSGCGGAVCAKILAEAGHRVVVVDKGYHFEPSQLPMDQDTGAHHLYEHGGLVNTDDGSVSILAGNCWGGGGTINWSCSLQTQGYVRQEWADDSLPFFTSSEYQQSLDRVCELMGVSDAYIRHNHGSQVILDGARKLGWDAKACPQNTAGAEHYCGRCHLGCPTAEKQGPTVACLPAAAKAGARFIEGFTVSNVLFDPSASFKRKKAIGVTGTWTARDPAGALDTGAGRRGQRTVRVLAKKVIVSAGSLNSPLLLMKSGLKNRHIGQNLHLHPCNYVLARFGDDMEPWEGGILTSACTSFENLDGKGHGVKLEACSSMPYITLANLPWQNGLDFKLNSLKLRHMNGYISLTRDRDSGRVFPDPATGRLRVEYTASALDRAHALTGLLALAKMCYVEGAEEIWAVVHGVPAFVRTAASRAGVDDPDFVAWLARVAKAGNKPPLTPFGSAHQMGTCRMSARPGDGVVDPRGRVWEVDGLYVADASVFPSASGVNPMVTNMAIADWIARGIAADLEAKSLL